MSHQVSLSTWFEVKNHLQRLGFFEEEEDVMIKVCLHHSKVLTNSIKNVFI